MNNLFQQSMQNSSLLPTLWVRVFYFGIKSASIFSHIDSPYPDHNDDNSVDCKRDTRILHAIPGTSHTPEITATSAFMELALVLTDCQV